MNRLEYLCIRARHTPWLRRADWLWDSVRAPYNKFVSRWGGNGLERIINGTDPIRVLPEFRGVTEAYEREVWAHVMARVQPGDMVADVGAYIGLYSVALAMRVGPSGKLIAFEPDAKNFAALEGHCRLNGLLDNVVLVQAAVADRDGKVSFADNRNSESHINLALDHASSVPCVRLDTVLAGSHLDILKIDVEGYEEAVLHGAKDLLQDEGRKPRAIYIEVHPYAWPRVGTTSDSLLELLASRGYNVSDLSGRPVKKIDSYGEIVADRATGE